MRFWWGVGGLVAAGMMMVPGLALAADAKLHLVIGGEGFDGPPKFAVSFAGQPVGDGTVTAAIDTTSAGRFADAKDQDKYLQNFDFTIPEAKFKPDGTVVIRLTNEAHRADGNARRVPRNIGGRRRSRCRASRRRLAGGQGRRGKARTGAQASGGSGGRSQAGGGSRSQAGSRDGRRDDRQARRPGSHAQAGRHYGSHRQAGGNP